jgi:signal transduction histidine kinase
VPYGDLAADVGIVAAGLLLTQARPRNPIGWLMLAFAWLGATQNLGSVYGIRATLEQLPLASLGLSVGASLWIPALFLPVTVLLVVYPDGRLPAAWWRWVNLAAVAAMAALTVALGLAPDTGADEVVGGRPVVALPPGVAWPLGVAGALVVVVAMLVSIAGALVRTWRARFPQRQQLLWLLTAGSAAVVVGFSSPPAWLFDVVLVAIPAAIVVGVLRYGLLGVEVVVHRTILYGSLTALVIGVYALADLAVTAAVPAGPPKGVVAAAAVAVVLVPVRDRLQRGVDRLVYGARHDPMRAVRGIGARLTAGSGDPLVAVVEAVAASVRARYAAIVAGGEVLAQAGSGSAGGDPSSRPLMYFGEHLADLVVVPAAGEAVLSAADRQIIEALAVPVAVVVHAGRLNAELAGARERIVTVALSERERIRRDLHDGLGPSLSGMVLGLDAARTQLRTDQDRAGAVIGRVRDEAHRAVEEVRRIIDALRPSTLDEHGLVRALRERADAVAQRAGLSVRVEAPEPMPDLPGPVEVAAYRIADEAITNAVRHAHAGSCVVRLALDEDLVIEVVDDGRGLPASRRDGVGLASMRQRAEELGGSFDIVPAEVGSRVLARIPLDVA